MSTPNQEAVPLPEILIFPTRLLSAERSEKLLNALYEVKHVRHITISGEGLPAVVRAGPATGQPVNHPERKVITVRGEKVELCLQVGRIFVEVDDIDNVQEVLEKVEKVCEELLPFGFSLEVGRFSKWKPTVTDFKKGKVK